MKRAHSLTDRPKKAESETPEISVVIPMKEEMENVKPLLSEIESALTGECNFEILCIDDGSQDDTLATLVEAKKQHTALRVLHHAKCCGQSTATLTGVRAARAPWIAIIDGDMQNPPAEIINLIAARDEAEDSNLAMVAGQRIKREDGWFKRYCSRFANDVRRRVLNDGIRDTGCSLKLIRRDIFLELPNFDHMHRFLGALVLRTGSNVLTVEVEHRARTAGKTKYGLGNRLWTGIVDLAGVLWLKRRAKHPIIKEVE
ncbi:MAG: dolichol-phosphate mannosyltransferase [Rhodospirillaceae bacterium]|nr:dolichol-phosphate mannosyltransferase [Rhodospirillaceae bacterium]|tara:strand:- start:3038 stop:3811 length:774 start_codon:yes stop_codon:yes gene_type:complete